MSVLSFVEAVTPQIVAPQDWGLSNRATNALMAANIVKHLHDVVETFPSGKLVHQGGDHGGQIGLVNNQGRLDYYVRYEVATIPELGRCATQVKLWRSLYAGVANLATRALNNILLAKFDAVVSDTRHTPDGERFWRIRLSDAASTKTIGCILGAADLQVYPPGTDIEDWLTGIQGWGPEARFRHIRFFISNLPPGTLSTRHAAVVTVEVHRNP